MPYLLDTSILARLANSNDVTHARAVQPVERLHCTGESLLVSPQNYVEFWNVATRPQSGNGLGLQPATVHGLIDAFEKRFLLVEESPAIYPALRKLLGRIEVVGKQVHDARLVAICHAHQLSHFLTFNVRHFVRFADLPPGIVVVEPKDVPIE
jgi:predicted nucleic acid-binding protein